MKPDTRPSAWLTWAIGTVVALAWALSPHPARAQSVNASINGMVTDPSLARAIQAMDANAAISTSTTAATHLDWQSLLPLIQDFWGLVGRRLDRKSRTGRLKQWLNFLRRSYPEAETAYMALRTCHEPERVDQWFETQPVNLRAGLMA